MDGGFTKLGTTPGGGSIAPTNVCRPIIVHVSCSFMIKTFPLEGSWIWIDRFGSSKLPLMRNTGRKLKDAADLEPVFEVSTESTQTWLHVARFVYLSCVVTKRGFSFFAFAAVSCNLGGLIDSSSINLFRKADSPRAKIVAVKETKDCNGCDGCDRVIVADLTQTAHVHMATGIMMHTIHLSDIHFSAPCFKSKCA